MLEIIDIGNVTEFIEKQPKSCHNRSNLQAANRHVRQFKGAGSPSSCKELYKCKPLTVLLVQAEAKPCWPSYSLLTVRHLGDQV